MLYYIIETIDDMRVTSFAASDCKQQWEKKKINWVDTEAEADGVINAQIDEPFKAYYRLLQGDKGKKTRDWM